jgi:hypothetical protein
MGLRGGAASTADIQNFCASLKPKARDGLLTVPLPERVDRVIVKVGRGVVRGHRPLLRIDGRSHLQASLSNDLSCRLRAAGALTNLRRTFPLRDGECSPLENRLQQQ